MNYKIQVILPALVAFVISVALSPACIQFLRRLKFGQYIREEGPEEHQKKAGTPTMGGVIFLLGILITSLFFVKTNPEIIPVLIATVGYGIIGFLDDFLKIKKKTNEGLTPWQKILGQIIVTTGVLFYLVKVNELGTDVKIPFTNIEVDFGIVYFIMFYLVMLGTTNGANLTDGLDGLATTVTVLIAAFFTILACVYGVGITPVSSAAVGALLGFLVFNAHPAKVFMGDTGSLALGGFVATTALMLKQPFLILIVAFIYFAETVSVMLQVSYFKITKKIYGEGRRIFKMTPIHHHFEKCGLKETAVVALFSIVTAIMCLVGFLAV